MRSEQLLPVVRDIVCLGLGTYGFAWQVTHGAELVLMVGCILTLAGPAVMAAWSLGRSNGASPTTGSSPPSPPSPLSPQPPSPSSSPAGGEPR